MATEHGDLVLRLGKAQVDAMFERQDHGLILDDSEFLPLVESVLTAFETAGIDSEVVEELWVHAYSRYDRACKEADPNSTTAENKELMRSYLRDHADSGGEEGEVEALMSQQIEERPHGPNQAATERRASGPGGGPPGV
jgi:hypothetical protein